MNPNDDPHNWVNPRRTLAYDTAIREAYRFLERAVIAHNTLKDGEDSGPHCAAAKRASMDLTRALAELRRS